MRIVHVIPYLAADGAFGGPASVALGQAAALAERGHRVTVVAGWDGVDDTRVPGVTLTRVRVRPWIPGFRFPGLWSLGWGAAVRRALLGADVAHIHFGRQLVSVAAARATRRAGIPLVLQPHGMLEQSRRLSITVADLVGVRSTVAAADRVLALTGTEAAQLRALGVADERLRVLPNGVTESRLGARQVRSGAEPEVLFLGRLHARKRPVAFVHAAKRVLHRGVGARFCLVGPDEGEGARVRAAIKAAGLDGRVEYEGPIAHDRARERMSRASVFVLPSAAEPFGMTVLEAAAEGVPCVIMADGGLSHAFSGARAAEVVDDVDDIADAVVRLLEDPPRAADMSARALALVRERFSVDAVAEQLDVIYGEVTPAAGSRRG